MSTYILNFILVSIKYKTKLIEVSKTHFPLPTSHHLNSKFISCKLLFINSPIPFSPSLNILRNPPLSKPIFPTFPSSKSILINPLRNIRRNSPSQLSVPPLPHLTSSSKTHLTLTTKEFILKNT